MMPAAKHFDPVLGVDIHIIQPPGPVPPVPIPHPFIGFILDPMDYVPIFGSTVSVNGISRAQAGTGGRCVPPHIPLGGVFVKPPANECEMFMGSSTVAADGDAFSYLALPALSCHDVGMVPPPRPKKKGSTKSMVLPTSVVLPIPAGAPVLVGGSPTISLMAMGMRLGMAGLARFARSGLARRAMAAFRRARRRVFRRLPAGFTKCKILRAEPVDITTGEVVVEQQDARLPWPLPLEWIRTYRSRRTRPGHCGRGWETPADIRLEFRPDGVVFVHPQEGELYFDRVPGPSDEPVFEDVDGGRLERVADALVVRLKSGLAFHFTLPAQPAAELPIARITDSVGRYLRFRREDGRVIEIVSSTGAAVRVEGRPGRIDALHLVHPDEPAPRLLARYEYDRSGHLIRVRDPLNSPYTFVYDDGRLVQHTDRRGLSFYYEYDGSGPEARVVHAWGDGGLYDYRFRHEGAGSLTRVTDSLGNTSVIELDGRGIPVKEIDPLGGITLYEYDDVGRTTAVVDPEGNRTEYHYDDHGNLVKLVRPDGVALLMEYDAADQLSKITDANGNAWTQGWDDRGLLARQTTPLGNTTRFEYDGTGSLSAVVTPRGARTAFYNDRFGNPVTIVDPLGAQTRLAWDSLGNLLSRTDALGGTSRYGYDAKSRLVEVISAAGRAESYGYDAEDSLTLYRDGEGYETQLEYVGLGEIARRLQPDGHTVEYRYDTEERLIAVVNQRGETYQLRRDALGRVVEEIDYWGQSKTYEYGRAGRLKRSRDALGREIRYLADPLGRVTGKRLPGGLSESFTYDPEGNVVGTENKDAVVKRVFDAEGRLLEEKINEFTIQNAYDENGNRTRRTTSLGNTVEYGYDACDRAVEIRVNDHEPIHITRDALGRAVDERLSSRLRRCTEYDADGLLTRQSATGAEGPVYERTYAYDRRGELIERTDSRHGAERFLYDPMRRVREHLDPEGATGAKRKYLYDPAGDLLRPGGAPEGRHPLSTSIRSSEARPWARTLHYGELTCTFDAAGNLVERRSGARITRLKWDANNRLVGSTAADGRVTTYAYDAQGRRVSKETTGQRASFGWEDDRLVSDQSADDDVEFFDSPYSFEPVASVRRGGHLQQYHIEPNGAPVLITDAAGAVAWSARYTPSGSLSAATSANGHQPIRLQGQYNDPETGLSYNRNRYFDAACGSFVSQDPVGLVAGDNLYRFAPNVWSWSDPLGLTCTPKKGAKRGPKTDPNAPHNAKIREVAAGIKPPDRVIAGGGVAPERLIPTPGGHKAGRRPDVLVERPDGSLYAVNVGRTQASGATVPREVKALDDLNNRAGIPTTFVPYDR